jgi:hypothetical protein
VGEVPADGAELTTKVVVVASRMALCDVRYASTTGETGNGCATGNKSCLRPGRSSQPQRALPLANISARYWRSNVAYLHGWWDAF